MPKNERFLCSRRITRLCGNSRTIAPYEITYRTQFSATHAPLAVDFFFLLSGFVIANAYQQRILSGFPFHTFIKLRLARLYPLLAFGVLLGTFGYLRLYSHSKIAFLYITGLLLIPTPFGSQIEKQPTMALNPPSWSLLWEIVAYLCFYLLTVHRSRKLTIFIVAVGLILLVPVAYYHCGLDVGSSWTTSWAGAPRVMFSFFLGKLMYERWQQTRFSWSLPLPLVLCC